MTPPVARLAKGGPLRYPSPTSAVGRAYRTHNVVVVTTRDAQLYQCLAGVCGGALRHGILRFIYIGGIAETAIGKAAPWLYPRRS
jgi:hypothetical protein